jgi:hypothetical protein
MSNTPRKAAATKARRCVMTLGGLSVVACATLTFGIAGPAAAQTGGETLTAPVRTLPTLAPLAATTPATAVQAPKTDGMPMPHPRPHHPHPHHHKCDRMHHDRDWHNDHWDNDGHEGSADS